MKLLFVNCCISRRGTGSRTHALAEAFLTAFRAAHPDAAVEEITQETLLALKPFDTALLQKRDALAEAGNFDAPVYALARQFREADAVVVAAPFWDLSYPAALRTYIEYISADLSLYRGGLLRRLRRAMAGVSHQRRRCGAGGQHRCAPLAAVSRHVRYSEI